MKAILGENILVVPLIPQAGFRMEKNEEKIRVDLKSATEPIEIVDNNSNHTQTSPGETYRITTKAHDRESCSTLAGKVNQVVPNLFDPQKGLIEGDTVTVEVATSSGTKEMAIIRNGNSLSVTVIGGSGTISVPVARSLFTPNRYGEYADTLRAVLIVVVYCAGFRSQPAGNEEWGFKKLRKKLEELWPL